MTHHKRSSEDNPYAAKNHGLDSTIFISEVTTPEASDDASEVVDCDNTAQFRWVNFPL